MQKSSEGEAKYGFLQLNETQYKEAIASKRYPEPKRYEQLTAYYPQPHGPDWKGLSLAELFPTTHKDLQARGVPDKLSAIQVETIIKEGRIPYEGVTPVAPARATEKEDIDMVGMFLLYHSLAHMDTENSPGIVVYPDIAKASPCKCAKVDGSELCFSAGIIGAMDEEQKEVYCNPRTSFKSPALQQRLKVFKQSVKAAQKKVKDIPKGERLQPWLSAMSEELTKRAMKV